MTIKTGDVVKLKSGGPDMTVVAIVENLSDAAYSATLADCAYAVGGEVKTIRVPFASLDKAKTLDLTFIEPDDHVVDESARDIWPVTKREVFQLTDGPLCVTPIEEAAARILAAQERARLAMADALHSSLDLGDPVGSALAAALQQVEAEAREVDESIATTEAQRVEWTASLARLRQKRDRLGHGRNILLQAMAEHGVDVPKPQGEH